MIDGEENGEDDIVSVQSQAPSERQLFFLDMGKDLFKNQLNLANDVLKQIVSTCVALMSVSVIFDALYLNDPKIKFFAVFMFFISLISACIGLFPYSKENIYFDSPSEIEQFYKEALQYKRIAYSVSAVFIIFGLALVLYKLFLQAFINTVA
jgi:hypothetical protein